MIPMVSSEFRPDFLGNLFERRPVYSWDRIAEDIACLRTKSSAHSIYTYRHASTEYNDRNLISGQRDVALSWQGIQQARSLAASIPKKYELIVCSQLKRTRQTMQLALGPTEPEPSFYVDERVDEVSLGTLEGTKRKSIVAFAEGNIDFAPPEGESYREAAQRAFSFLIDLSNANNRTSLVFTHAGILRIFSTIVSPLQNGKEMFALDFKNTFLLRLDCSNLRLPSFWLR